MSSRTDNRLQVRLPPAYRAWLATLGGDESSAARSLLAAGAALLGYDGAAAEATGLLRRHLDRDTLLWLYDRCTTGVRQVYDAPAEAAEVDDPLGGVGIEV